MKAVKPKVPRRVAPHDEEAMRKFSVRLSQQQAEALRALGDGNISLGARRVLAEFAKQAGISPGDYLSELRTKTQTTSKGKSKGPSAKPVGRPAVTVDAIKSVQAMYSDDGRSIKDIAKAHNLHPSTVYRYIDIKKKKPGS